MPTNRINGDQEIDPAMPFRPKIEAEEAAQRMRSEISTATPPDTIAETKLKGETSISTTSKEQTSDNLEQEVEDLPDFQQPETDVSQYADKHIAQLADISGLSCKGADKVRENCDTCSEYFYPQRPTLSRLEFNTTHVDSDPPVTPWWESDGEDTEIIEDRLTINIFGE